LSGGSHLSSSDDPNRGHQKAAINDICTMFTSENIDASTLLVLYRWEGDESAIKDADKQHYNGSEVRMVASYDTELK
jgi:hypothetical protein